MKIEAMNFLPIKFDSDVLFELPQSVSQWNFANKCKTWTKSAYLVQGEDNQH
jgi:hypothetical protein